MKSEYFIVGISIIAFVSGYVDVGIIKDATINSCDKLETEVSRIEGEYENYRRRLRLKCVDASRITKEDIMEKFKDVKCIIDFTLNNTFANELGETLQVPVITNAPNVVPIGKFTISMYPDYELVNNITVETLKLFAIEPVALLYDLKRSYQAANLQTMARKANIRMILMPEIDMDDRKKLAYAAGELKRSHLEAGVLLCDPREIYKVMDEALEFDLFENKDKGKPSIWKWIATDLDFKPSCSETLHGFAGLAMSIPNYQEIEDFRRSILTAGAYVKSKLSNTFYANLHDSIHIVLKSVNNESDSLLSRLRWAKLPACTAEMRACGWSDKVEFEANRARKIEDMRVVDIDKKSTNNNQLRDIGEWTPEKGTKSNNNERWTTDDQRKKCSLSDIHSQKKTLRILVKEDDDPFVFIANDTSLPMLERFTGFCIDIVKELSNEENMNFSFTIEIAKNGTGKWQVNTSRWSGIIGELIDQNAEMGTGSLTITASREKAIDFSKPFMDFTMALILRKPKEEEQNMFRFLDPFSPIVWLCTVLAVFAMTISMYIVDYLSPYGYRKTAMGTEEPGDEFTLYNSLWFATASMLQQGGDNTPKSPSGRLLAASFWFFVLLMISTYTANLAAFFTNKKPKITINNLADLVKQTKIQFGVFKNGQIHTFLEKSNSSVYKKMFMRMKKDNTFQTGATKAVKKARTEDFAYLTETPILEYHNSREPCNTMLVKNLLEAKSYGFALPKNSELTTNLSVNILKLREKGFMDERYRYWWKERSQCSTTVKKVGLDSIQIQFQNMAGVFIVLVSGVIISFFLLVMEVKFKWVIDFILETGCEQCTDYYCEDSDSYEYMEPTVDATTPSNLKRVPDAYSNVQESKV